MDFRSAKVVPVVKPDPVSYSFSIELTPLPVRPSVAKVNLTPSPTDDWLKSDSL